MSKKLNIIGCIADNTETAQSASNALKQQYGLIDVTADNLADIDVVIALGGDGLMLHSLHQFMDRPVPIYGMNCGTVGFLMNDFDEANLLERLSQAETTSLHPLHMEATDAQGRIHKALAINEVSLLRETYQAAHIQIAVDHSTQIEELVCDGIIISTAAGSSAYNSSVGGPVIPLGSNILALTPISPFRPKRWRGALLPHTASFQLEVKSPHKRPVSAVADFTEIRDVVTVEVQEDSSKTLELLFDPGHSLEDRILKEQFVL